MNLYNNHSYNMEMLRDFGELFPDKDHLANAYGKWMWAIDDDGYLHVTQPVDSDRTDILGEYALDFMFEGDGVVKVYLRNLNSGDTVASEIYDSHCLDHGAGLKRIFTDMNPRGRKFRKYYHNKILEYENRRTGSE